MSTVASKLDAIEKHLKIGNWSPEAVESRAKAQAQVKGQEIVQQMARLEQLKKENPELYALLTKAPE